MEQEPTGNVRRVPFSMKAHQKLKILLIMVLLLQQALFASLNLTDEEQSYIASRAPVRSVTVGGAGPIQYIDSHGRNKGISIRVLEEIGERTGLTFDPMLYDRIDDAYSAYSDGTDILFGIPDQYARPGYTLSEPFLRSQTILFANKNLQAKDLQGKRFAATHFSPLPEGIQEEQAIYYYSREDAIAAVDKGEADFGYGNAYSVAFYTLQHGLQNIYTVPQGKEERQYRILFIKDDPLLVSIINKAITSFSPQEMQNIILEATSQVERIITFSMIMDSYGMEIFLIALIIIAILTGALAIIQNSRTTLDLEQKKFRAIAEVSNEYLFEFDTRAKTLIPYEKFKTLFTTHASLQAAQKKLISHLATLSSIEQNSVIELQLPSGRSSFFRVSSSKVTGKKGRNRTWIGKMQDISEEVKKQNHLKNLAQTDGLTSLFNAATTRSKIEERLQLRQSSEIDFCILVDLDEFKKINDTKGHLGGNMVLETLGKLIRQGNHTSKDIMGRVGGDEFCIYLVAIPDAETALTYCTSLLESVRFRLYKEGVTISMGVAEVEKGETYEALYARVDRALYQAKSKGRNRIEIADAGKETPSSVQKDGRPSR